MYGRKLDGRTLDFGHQGALYRNSFLMYDRQTESLWLHVTGRALRGELKGSQLPFIASEVTSWGDWALRHPHTKVLLGDKAGGFMGTFQLEERASDFGLSVGQGLSVKLYPYSLLARVPVMNDSHAGDEIVLTYDAARRVASAWSRRLEGRELHFEAVLDDPAAGDPAALMRDSESGSLWLRNRGECIAGDLEGASLERLTATPWLSERWHAFFPDGEVVTLAGPKGSHKEASSQNE